MDIRRMFTYDYNSNLEDDLCPTNEIWYTSSDNNVVTPYKTNVFGANIISNKYNNGMGVITFDSDVTTIGNYAFYGCDSLTSVTIGDSVTTIGGSTFYNCTSLTSVNIPDSVTSIGNYAFRGCTGLTSIEVPDSVTEIGYYAFYGCSSLRSVYCKATTPPALGGTNVFDYNGSGRIIYVPASSVNMYKSATNWSKYKSYIFNITSK